MKSKVALLKLTLCGPGDVGTEINIAKEVIDEWNRQHAEFRGLLVKHRHWSTDTYPNMSDRTQAVVNPQIIDDAKVLVAVFWSRFGTPTGVADSGTEEEIRRSVAAGRKTMVYFSDREPMPADADADQIGRLWKFRQELRPRGIVWNFTSRNQFRELFRNHLAMAMNTFEAPAVPKRARPVRTTRKQTAKGKNIVQQMGDGNTVNQYQEPPKVVNVLERRPGSVTAEEEHQISEWISKLADGEIKMERSSAFGMWWNRFYGRFKVTKCGELDSGKMDEVKVWHRQQSAIQTSGLRSRAPDFWRNKRITAIKTCMGKMRIVDKLTYYRDLSEKLKMKKAFTSLKDLTKANLDRVYRKVLEDARKNRS